jgi:hypothetical protein
MSEGGAGALLDSELGCELLVVWSFLATFADVLGVAPPRDPEVARDSRA